jgi:AraC-like DNA-binding protein
MQISLSHILFVLIIFQLLFLSFFLFIQRKGRKISNLLLASFFLSISLNLLDVFLLISGVYSSHPFLLGWGSCLPLLFGPLIYLYSRSVIHKDFRINAKNLMHFFPFIILFLATESFFLLQTRIFQQRLLTGLIQHRLPPVISIFSTLIFVQFLFYIIASWRLVYQYKQAAGQYYSNTREVNLSWLFSTILFFFGIAILCIINGLLIQTVFADYFLFGFNLIIFAMLIFIITVLLKALQKPYFFSFSDEPVYPLNTRARTQTAADPAEMKKTAQSLLDFMQENKPYRDPELTLEQLATRLSLKPRVLSQVINEIIGQNFYNFINRYRIQEASRLLTNPKDKKITILEVLYEVGFNSKSSFNTLFKKYMGLTPTDFKKKQGG